MLAGHPYIVNDAFLNMNIVNKLKAKGIGIITGEFAPSSITETQIKKLLKKPFWTFKRIYTGLQQLFMSRKKYMGLYICPPLPVALIQL